jgi:Uma2 family endonuclease
MNGQVYAMAGASVRHNLITVNAGSFLNAQLPEECEVFVADIKVRIHTQRKLVFYYPDIVVSCAGEDQDIAYREKPCLIIEVISLFTERQDRFEKFWSYQQISTLQEYVLLNQNVIEATLFRRSRDWQLEKHLSGEIYLESVGLTIPLNVLYRRVRLA